MAGFIEGVGREQSTLFLERLEDWVGEDHLVRVVDLFVEELDLPGLGFERTAAARTGRPGYHPAVLLKPFIYGYLNRVPSSRRLEREAGRNVELMWLTGRLVPDHKTVADFRRDNGPAIRRTCARFVELCRRIGVLKGDCVAIDGSKFKAVNNRDLKPTTETTMADRGLRGVKLVIADDHKGLRAASLRVFNATHQRCRIHWMGNALAHAPAKQRTAVAAMLKTIFAQQTRAEAEAQWEIVADALREKQPKLGAPMDASRYDVLAYMSFPREHWTQIVSTNPLERVNREVKRRADVIGIFPNGEAIIRLVGALMLETNDEWAVARRYMSLETLARVTDNPTVRLPAVAA